MTKRLTARQQEIAGASKRAPRTQRKAPVDPLLSFLLRRGIEVKPSEPDLPFPPGFAGERALGEMLDSYAFRLFLRGAILKGKAGFKVAEPTRYVDATQAEAFAKGLLGLRLLELKSGRFRLTHPARNFGCTLEWYVGSELSRRLGFEVATGLLWRAKGVGGDLDVVALADSRLAYLELKSGPPKHLSTVEVACFLDRVRALRPDTSLLVFDTSLRMSDKVLPMLAAELERRGAPATPTRLVRDVWRVRPNLYLCTARWDLMGNVIFALAEGLRELAPVPP